MRTSIVLGTLAGVLAMAPASAANLIVNGNFEASTSPTATPPGWTNIGHSDGVIAYSQFGTPAYDGDYFYDLGGFGDANGPIGDGIKQSVNTVIGQSYKLTFGLSSEDVAGNTGLTVKIGGSSWLFDLTSGGTFLAKAFATQSIDYVATGMTTDISFTIAYSTVQGNNDPMIDRVIFETADAVPEPATWATMTLGLCLLGGALRRRKALGLRTA